MMGEAPPEGGTISRQEFDELRTGMGELRSALDELKQARSEPERREARAEVRDAKADLAATAKELGLDPARLEKAASEARRSDELERLRPLLIELLDEELAEPVEEAAQEVAQEAAGAVQKAAEAVPKPDTPPSLGHWSERPLSSLFGGDDGR